MLFQNRYELSRCIIRKTTGLFFSKRWVSFHKTMRILFEGFSHPSFLFCAPASLRILSAPDFQKEDSQRVFLFLHIGHGGLVTEEITFTNLRVYTYKKGMQKTMQTIHRTLHNPLHQFDYLNVTQCMIYVLNPTQTLH